MSVGPMPRLDYPARVFFSSVLLVACCCVFASADETEAVVASKRLNRLNIDRNVIYCTHDGASLKADIYQPAASQTSAPGVLMIHGGAWMSGSKFNMAVHAMKLARKGYVVMTINYRLAPKHKFPAQLDDCEAALGWLAANADRYSVDTDRLAAYGYSAGGHLACLLGMRAATNPIRLPEERAPDVRLHAIVAGGSPCEFRSFPKESRSLAYWLGGSRDQVPDQYNDASPTAFVSANAPPTFFFHGENDRLVPLKSPAELQKLLAEKQVVTEMLVVKDGGHMEAFFDGDAMDAAGRFLDEHLKSRIDKLSVRDGAARKQAME
ncbi:MAG: alpha/beta hydrolase [Planctomycetales bacterium]|nr:alpha/beta hydrolase [Planctomycetales bacterium]